MSDPVTEAPHVSDLPDFWRRLGAAHRSMLILDYDGTLAPFVVNRREAFPLDGIRDTLCAIRDETDTRLAIVTGRPIGEILELIGDLKIPIVGSQGTEFRYPDGRWFTLLPTAPQRARLIEAEQEALTLAPRTRVERKPASIALHTRGEPALEARASEEAVCRLWMENTEDIGLRCRHFLGGVELRLTGITKGTAIQALIEDCSEADLVVYIGDDETDEDAFRALKGRGISIRVGDETVPTHADSTLRDITDVRWFIRRWLDVARDRGEVEQEWSIHGS